MPVTYYRVLVDSTIPDLWFLGEPVDENGETVDARRFTCCFSAGVFDSPLTLPIKRVGRPGRLTLAAFDMPVVDLGLGKALVEAAGSEVEMVPARSEDGMDLMIANVLPAIDCIDESRTVGDKWSESDNRPGKTGMYRTIVSLVLDPSRIRSHIFRVEGWRIALIVSDTLVEATGLDRIEGLRLQPVS